MIKDYQYDLTPTDARRGVKLVKGKGQANIHMPSLPLDFDSTDEKLFPALKGLGMIGYGEGCRWDDRKYRLNSHSLGFGTIEIPLGLTYFQAGSADIERDDASNRELQDLGERLFNDKWALFSRPVGAAFIPITQQGSVFVGVRTGRLYEGWLNAAAGNVDFHGDPDFGKFREAARKELTEEYGQSIGLVGNPRFVGIASHSIKGDADMVWVGRISKKDDFFQSGKWAEDRSDSEHAPELIRVSSTRDRDRLLKGGKSKGRRFPGVMYSTRLGLEALTAEDFRPLK